MKYLKVLVTTGFLIALAQASNPDTIYFKDGTVIEDCKILETQEDSIKVKILEQERPSEVISGAIERLWKEEWFSTDDILKIKYENGRGPSDWFTLGCCLGSLVTGLACGFFIVLVLAWGEEAD